MTSKNKAIFSSLGGIFVAGAGILGWMLWDKLAFADEAAQELASEESKYTGHSTAKVFPCKASLDSIKTNRQSYIEWYDASIKAVSAADKAPSTETPAAFKQRLTQAVANMKSLEGGLEGRIASQTFLFGFDKYLGENTTMPPDKDVPRLAAELDTIVHIVNLLSESEIVEVRKIDRLNDVVENAEPVQQAGRRRPAKKKATETEGPKTTVLKYNLEFTTRPIGLVEVLNRLSSDPNFITITDFSMRDTSDTIVEKFSASDSAKAMQAQGSSRRRRSNMAAAFGLAPAAEQKKEEPKLAHRLVTDPESDAPIYVTMTLTVTDFGRPVQKIAAPVSEAAPAGAAPAEKAAPAPAQTPKPAPAPKKEEK